MLERIDRSKVEEIAVRAGREIMEIYDGDFGVEYKDDDSPLTQADLRSNAVICEELTKLYPEIPILSEESAEIPYEERSEWEYYWCIDPLDGTKEFIKRNGEFTVNIALIHWDTPVLGVVYAPAIEDLYSAEMGVGAFKNGERLPLIDEHDKKRVMRVVASKSHLTPETQEFIDTLSQESDSVECISKGSSLKLCLVAEGSADIYPRLAPTMEWDTAAAHAVVLGAGKRVLRYDTREPLVYNKRELLNPWFVVMD